MQNETISFSDALNETLHQPKRIKPEKLNPESFKNYIAVGGASRAGKTVKIELLKEAYSNTEWIGTNKDFGVTTNYRELKNPTRESYDKAMKSLKRLEEQSIVSNDLVEKINKDLRIRTNPTHYGIKATKRARLHKPNKFFGDSKSIVYVRGKNGEPKPMSLKNAKKKGYI